MVSATGCGDVARAGKDWSFVYSVAFAFNTEVDKARPVKWNCQPEQSRSANTTRSEVHTLVLQMYVCDREMRLRKMQRGGK
jgi:hypothetical protein